MDNERLSPVKFEKVKGDELKHLNDDMVDDVPIIEKRNRRRSSFFAELRKSMSESRKDFEEISPEEENVSKYIEEIKKEKKEWLDVTRKRKRDYENTCKKYNEHCKERQIMMEEECLPYLDENDKKYLSDLPNFESIAIKYSQLRKFQIALEESRRRNIRVAKQLLNSIRKDVEDKKQDIKRYSEIQPL